MNGHGNQRESERNCTRKEASVGSEARHTIESPKLHDPIACVVEKGDSREPGADEAWQQVA
jgi:hypothetical protein